MARTLTEIQHDPQPNEAVRVDNTIYRVIEREPLTVAYRAETIGVPLIEERTSVDGWAELIEDGIPLKPVYGLFVDTDP